MWSKLASWFPASAGVLLILTAVAKLASACGSAKILDRPDFILPMTNRWLLVFVAVLELAVAGICFSRKNLQFKAGAVAWLGSMFLIYRLGFLWAPFYAPCKCLGYLTDAIHLTAEQTNTIASIILAYLLVGSYSILFWLWRSKCPR